MQLVMNWLCSALNLHYTVSVKLYIYFSVFTVSSVDVEDIM